MPIYRCPIVGTGTDADPIRAPYSGDPRIGWICLGPPGSAAGFGILYLPTAVVDARLTLIADSHLDILSAAGRNQIGNALGITLQNNRVADILGETLMDNGRADGTRWKGIRGCPSRIRNAHEIWLGELGRIWADPVPPVPASQTFTETWPSAGTITSGQDQTWVEVDGTSTVVAGVVQSATVEGIIRHIRCESVLDTSNQRHQATFALNNHSDTVQVFGWLGVRYADGANFYRLRFDRTPANRQTQKRVASVNTNFASDSTDPGASGTGEFIVDGSTVTGKLGGSTILGPSTDGSPDLLTNFKGGAVFFVAFGGAGVAEDATWDNHTIADVVAAAAGYLLVAN